LKVGNKKKEVDQALNVVLGKTIFFRLATALNLRRQVKVGKHNKRFFTAEFNNFLVTKMCFF
jgi:hypothetical protein